VDQFSDGKRTFSKNRRFAGAKGDGIPLLVLQNGDLASVGHPDNRVTI
jgi:hypothetical protein